MSREAIDKTAIVGAVWGRVTHGVIGRVSAPSRRSNSEVEERLSIGLASI